MLLFFHYLFDRFCPFLAFLNPNFFLSLTLGSLLRKPKGFNVALSWISFSTRHLEKPNLIASDIHAVPHHFTVISASYHERYVSHKIVNGAIAFAYKWAFHPKNDLRSCEDSPWWIVYTHDPWGYNLTTAVVDFLLHTA